MQSANMSSYYSEGLLEEAIEQNIKKLQAEPDNHILRCSLAKTLMQKGSIIQAIEEFEKCIELNPSAEYYNNLGKALNNSGSYQRAIDAFEEVKKLRRWPDAFFHQAVAYRSLGKLDKADILLKEALKINPRYREALNERALILEALGKKDEALLEYKKVIALFFSEYQAQESEMYSYDTSVLLDNVELVEELIRQLRRHVGRFPGYADGYYKLGQALEARGMESEAMMAFRRALEINPHYETARKCFWKK